MEYSINEQVLALISTESQFKSQKSFELPYDYFLFFCFNYFRY